MHGPSTASRREPAINLPAPLLAWIGVLVAIQAIRSLLSTETDVGLLLELAFVPSSWSVALGLTTPETLVEAARVGGGDDPQMRIALARFMALQAPRPWSPISYSVLHGSWAHVGLNCLWLAAFGALVVRRIGIARSSALWVVTAFGGALAQWLGDPQSTEIMIGASASISGFMAAAATFMYGPTGPGRWSYLRNRNVLLFLGLWLVANLVFALIAEPLGLSDSGIAWKAHVGGLVAALALFPFLDRPDRRDRSGFPS